MVTGNVRFDQQADRITSELTATGEQVALQQMAGGIQRAAGRRIKRSGRNRKSTSAARRPTNRPPIGWRFDSFRCNRRRSP